VTTATIQSQKLATNPVTSLFEIDFTSIGGSAKVHLSDGMERNSFVADFEVMQVNWFGSLTTFEHIEIELSGSRSDLTGNISEPTLSIAADKLWSFSNWASATSGMNLMDYRGITVRRQRLFYNTPTLVQPQVYFVKSVNELSSSSIIFTLTPMLGGDNSSKPSARKLEL
jgi:hypothetical protein